VNSSREPSDAETGRDLQYVRINGAFVGGVIGVPIHAAMRGVARWDALLHRVASLR
jgi:uncharacterized membrane-anchored protein YjiN (DUF445 family)